MAKPAAQQSPLGIVAGIGGAAGGWALAHYSGLALLIPLVAAIGFVALLVKTPIRPRGHPMAIALALGHLAWMVVGAAMLNVWSTAWLDLTVFGAAVAWRWVRPGMAAAVTLGVLEGLALSWNGYQLATADAGSVASRGLVVPLPRPDVGHRVAVLRAAT